MNITHALTLKGLSALILGVTIMTTGCKKDESQSPELTTDLLNQSGESIMATTTMTTSGSLFNEDFEQPDFKSSWGLEIPSAASVTQATSPVRSGSSSAKFVLNKTDIDVSGSKRTELRHLETLPQKAERWYGLSVYLPTSYVADPAPELIFQWHNVPNFKQGETWAMTTSDGGVRATPLHVQTVNGRFVLQHALSSIPGDYKSPTIIKQYDLGAYQTGVWTDFVIHAKFTYLTDGIIEIWKNGVLAQTIKGQTYYNDETGPYFKMGIYKWAWKQGIYSNTTQRTLYFDNLKIGSENSSYDQVAPGNGPTAPAPTTEPTTTPTTTPTTSTSNVVFAVNAGGSAHTAKNGITYKADNSFSGGSTSTVQDWITFTDDDALYQSERYGNFNYKIPVNNGTYEITFKFAETFHTALGKRQFDVLAENQEVIGNLDIFKEINHDNAYDVVKTVTVTDGTLDLIFRGDIGDAKIGAFHVIQKTTSTTTPVVSPTVQEPAVGSTVYAINAGGTAFKASNGITYQADTKFSGGTTNKVQDWITFTNDDALYQSERTGNFSYNLPITNGTYEITFKFAEILYKGSGKRQFDVLAENQEIISNLDIFKQINHDNAYDVKKTVTVTDGNLNLQFRTDIGAAKIGAFHIIKK